MSTVRIREAAKADLSKLLAVYGQPGMDEEVLEIAQAEQLFERFGTYPNYKLYVAEQGTDIVGTFALLIMDNLGHLGTPSGVIEDVAVRHHGMRHARNSAAGSGPRTEIRLQIVPRWRKRAAGAAGRGPGARRR